MNNLYIIKEKVAEAFLKLISVIYIIFFIMKYIIVFLIFDVNIEEKIFLYFPILFLIFNIIELLFLIIFNNECNRKRLIKTALVVNSLGIPISFWSTLIVGAVIFEYVFNQRSITKDLIAIIFPIIFLLGIKGINVAYYIKLLKEKKITRKQIIIYCMLTLIFPIDYIALIDISGKQEENENIKYLGTFFLLSIFVNTFLWMIFVGGHF